MGTDQLFATAYVSGPMTGYKEFNFPAFDSCARQLRDEGVYVYSPADHDRQVVDQHWPGKAPEDFPGYAEGDLKGYFDAVSSGGAFTLDAMLAWDFAVIGEDSDAIIMLPGWEQSSGARAERFVAEMTKKQVWLANETWVWDLGEVGHKRGWYFTLDGEQKRMTPPQVRDTNPQSTRDLLQPFPGPTITHDALVEYERSSWAERTGLDHGGTGGASSATVPIKEFVVSGDVPNEVRIVNDTTGGAKGQKDVQLSCCPPEALRELGRVFAMGAKKYDRNNFRKGYAWSLSADALLRHVLEWLDGNDLDEESGLNHLAHAMWHCANLIQLHKDHPALDDRWTSSQGE